MHFTLVEAWAAATPTGDRGEVDELPDDLPFWPQISATAEHCLGTECPQYGDCFVTQMRQRAADSDVVIVNHHLLCADAALRHHGFGEVIPECPAAVVDEAHQLEDVATQYFGVAVSNSPAGRARGRRRARGCVVARLTDADEVPASGGHAARARRRARFLPRHRAGVRR